MKLKIGFTQERGQALILITLAAVGLFAIVGLAIDGGAKFSDMRHAQSAADTSALAAALNLAQSGLSTKAQVVGDPPNGIPAYTLWVNDAKNRAADNGYSEATNIQVNLCSDTDVDCGPYTGNYQYVRVVIDSYVNTTFAKVIGVRELHNRVEAVTYWAPSGPTFGPELIKSLSPEECNGDNGNIVFGGNGDITLNGGGAYINSGGSGCGMELTGCGNLIVNDGDLSSIGDGNINITTSSDTCAENLVVPDPTYNYNDGIGYPWPPYMPDRPEECNIDAAPGTWTNVDGVSTMNPGLYAQFPPKTGVESTIVMNPGIYCVEKVVKLVDQSLDLYGTDILIFIRDGGQFDIQGGTIHIEGRYQTSSYPGYLIIVNSDFEGPIPNCTINGNSLNVYVGTIYAPYCDLVFNGTNETGDPDLNYNVQVVGYTITLNGNSNINFTYDPDKVAVNDPKVGLMR